MFHSAETVRWVFTVLYVQATLTHTHIHLNARKKRLSLALSGIKQQRLNECKAEANTVCKCVSGFYCNNAECEHCLPVTRCQVGEGVKTPGNLEL